MEGACRCSPGRDLVQMTDLFEAIVCGPFSSTGAVKLPQSESCGKRLKIGFAVKVRRHNLHA